MSAQVRSGNGAGPQVARDGVRSGAPGDALKTADLAAKAQSSSKIIEHRT